MMSFDTENINYMHITKVAQTGYRNRQAFFSMILNV